MARSPQSFEKRQRERRKQQKREEKQQLRYERNAEKKRAQEAGEFVEEAPITIDEDGNPIETGDPGEPREQPDRD